MLPGMNEAQRMDAWHLVDPAGRVYSAGAALVPLGRLLPGGRPVAWLAARFPGGAERAYRTLSGHRSVLGRLVTRGATRRAGERIEAAARRPPPR